MYSEPTPPPQDQTRRFGKSWFQRNALYIGIVLSFVVLHWKTSPDYIGDTTRWAADALDHWEGQPAQFWEFGHLLWRPWGYMGYSLLGDEYIQWFGDTPFQAMVRILIHTNFVCSALALLLMAFLLNKVVGPCVALSSCLAMNCSAAFLNYSHSGAPYVPALMFSLLTLCFAFMMGRQTVSGRRYAIFAGISFAFSCALWIAFSFSGAGMLAGLYLWPSGKVSRENGDWVARLRLVGAFLCSAILTTLVLFSWGVIEKDIGSIPQLVQWIHESDNGLLQSGNAMRAVTGLTRSVWSMGNDTVFLKRWIWSDPYNPASLYQVWAFRLTAKIILFYLALGGALWVLWHRSQPLLIMLIAAAVPMLLFAILLFEPSAPERFLPLFPFAFPACAITLGAARRHPFASICTAIFLTTIVLSNLWNHWIVSSDFAATTARFRIEALNRAVTPDSVVFVPTLDDEAYRTPPLNPLDHHFANLRYVIVDAVVLASQDILGWRAQFARRTLDQWKADREVWISERFLASQPKSAWKWVEGDDRRIHWSDLPAMFTPLEFDARILPLEDGFARVANTPANRERLIAELGAAMNHPNPAQ